MRFSFIIPVYNAERYLQKCLDSILAQSYEKYEVICINDASTDSSLEILQSYAKRYEKIRVIDNKHNMGPSCRNEGLKVAQGDYILFVDSDDYICEDTLQICKERLENKSIDILEFGCRIISERMHDEDSLINERECISQIENPVTGIQWLVQRYNEKNYLGISCAKAFNREFLKRNNIFFYEGILHEDELFLQKCLVNAKRVISTVDFLYIYRRRENSVTTQKHKVKNLDSLIIVLNEVQVLWSDLKSEEEREIVARYKKSLLKRIKMLMMKYPEHTKMSLGTNKDQHVFDQIYAMDEKIIRKKTSFTERELASIQKYNRILVYGAGVVAIEVLQLLEEDKVTPEAVVVTHKDINDDYILGHKIYEIGEYVCDKDDILVLVAVSKNKQGQIVENLSSLKFKNILCIER